MGSERVVVVTGAASGIGLGIAKRFVALGHPVAMLDRSEDLLATESAALREAGGRVAAIAVDVSDRAQVDQAYAVIREAFGPIAIVVANAGICTAVDFLKLSLDDWRRMIDVNLTGVFHTVQPAIQDMVDAGWGRIITISSQAGQTGGPRYAHYSAAKGGVIAFTKALAAEFARAGITANSVPPSLIDTPLARRGADTGEVLPIETFAQHMPVGRAGTPEDVAGAVMWLASDDAAFVTGQTINVNGGTYS